MKDEVLALVADTSNPAQKLNLLREFVQALILRSLHESEAFVNLAFVGGTALRFVYALPRFSEDLDFSLHKKGGYTPEAWMKKVKRDLALAGFNVRITWNDKTVVHKAWIRIADLMHEAGLAGVPQQNLSIKLEIDTLPPPGHVSERSIITRHRLLALHHYDLPSLMSGKLHALLTRKYPKGRDWYDLVWYRGRRPPVAPNLVLLQNALNQTEEEGACEAANWKHTLRDRIENLDDRQLVADVQPFLEHPEEAELLRTEHVLSVL
ncbi:MAG: nucleotidyl transferase AbiEii/AbiGii toxin family protein [Lentisphaeria bacterium]